MNKPLSEAFRAFILPYCQAMCSALSRMTINDNSPLIAGFTPFVLKRANSERAWESWVLSSASCFEEESWFCVTLFWMFRARFAYLSVFRVSMKSESGMQNHPLSPHPGGGVKNYHPQMGVGWFEGEVSFWLTQGGVGRKIITPNGGWGDVGVNSSSGWGWGVVGWKLYLIFPI